MTERKPNAPVNDIYNVWDGTRYVFTLRKISQISGMAIPEEFTKDLDTPIAELKIRTPLNGIKSRDHGLQVLFCYNMPDIELLERYIKNGVILISDVLLKDESGKPYPMIALGSRTQLWLVFCSIGKYIKSIFPIPTIGVTGSIGKTTATRFLENIFAERYSVFTPGGNNNTPNCFINQMILRYGPERTFHVQECGAGEPGLVERSANLISADAFCITNILPHHLDQYKTIEDILYDKTSFDRVPGKECFGVINIDDDRLRNHKFNNRIITCGIKHMEADYVAKNIRQNGLFLELDIVYTADGGAARTVPIKINIPGVHNANGAVMAFAMAKEWGLTDEEIQNGFLKYRSDPIRQSLKEVSGRLMYVDCFNVAAGSIRSCLETLGSFEVKEGNRKIAVLGGENTLGDYAFSNNYALGLSFADFHVDEYIFVGKPEPATEEEHNLFGHGYALYQGAKKALRGQTKISYMSDFGEAADKLASTTKPGDIILFKGIFRLTLPAIIDRAFGTSYTVYAPRYYPTTPVRENNCSADYFIDSDSCNIRSGTVAEGKIHIPNTITGHPVSRVGRRVFRNNTKIKEIDFGLSCMNIGAECFQGCTGITFLNIPRNILHIEAGAFADCSSLESVIIHGVEHIETGAFRNCRKLKQILLPDTCCTIEEGVFDGCPDVTVTAPKNSLAASYARENGLKLCEV